MRSWRKFCVELVPELWRLIAEIPFRRLAAWAEHPFLGAHRFLIPPNASDDAGIAVFFQQ